MAEISLTPIIGMNNVARDDNMSRGGDSPAQFARDAVNIDIHADGSFSMRRNARKISDLKLSNVWQSPLHGDVFCVHNGNLCKLNTADFSVSIIARNIGAGRVYYEVVNNLVYIATSRDIFVYDGEKAQRLGIDTPPSPVVIASEGSLTAGSYGVAVSWLRKGKEGGISAASFSEIPNGGGLSVIMPFCMDDTIDSARLYVTRADGGELSWVGDYPVSGTVEIPLLPNAGKTASMRYLSPMPTGRFLKLWHGRLITAKANIIRFSEPLAYHLHDERFGYVQMPQRITFIEPVEGGLFVGQVDSVVFLRGADIEGFEMINLAAKAPIPDSSMRLKADEAGQLSSGSAVCVWIADNGIVAGLPDGSISEIHAGILTNIKSSSSSKTVIHNRRVVSLMIDS